MKRGLGLCQNAHESEDIEDLLSFSQQIDEAYESLSLPEECGNAVFCSQCGCYSLCKFLSLSKTCGDSETKEDGIEKETADQGQLNSPCQSKASISYFKKWVCVD